MSPYKIAPTIVVEEALRELGSLRRLVVNNGAPYNLGVFEGIAGAAAAYNVTGPNGEPSIVVAMNPLEGTDPSKTILVYSHAVKKIIEEAVEAQELRIREERGYRSRVTVEG